MVKIRPFNAIRPPRDKAGLLASRSYLSYSNETLKEKLKNNPFTFLHIINPDHNNKTKNKKNRFKLIKKKFNEFIQKKYLIKDEELSYYIYQQKSERNIFSGVIAAVSVEDYLNGSIKKHEHTIKSREAIFKKYLETTGFNADPVLLCYKRNKTINQIIKHYQSERAEYEFSTTNEILHKLWLIQDANHIKNITNTFKNIDKIYIADGHHRTASSSLLSRNKRKESSKYFMSLLISDEELKIINFNRLIKEINNLTNTEFLNKIRKYFNVIESKNCTPKRTNEIGMYLKHKSYILKLKDEYKKEDCVNKLDSAIISNNILRPILNIKNERTSENIDFISGKVPIEEIKDNINSNKYKVAFILKPITINEIKSVSDANKVMPPKSTYIEPKLRSGLTIYQINK